MSTQPTRHPASLRMDLLQMERERLYWVNLADERARRNELNDAIVDRMTMEPRKWRTVKQVAAMAVDKGVTVSPTEIQKELVQILGEAQFGNLTRDGKLGLFILMHGMKPFRLTQQFLRTQAVLMGGFEQMAKTLLDKAVMPGWACAEYREIAERRARARDERKVSEQPPPHANKTRMPKGIAEIIKIAHEIWPSKGDIPARVSDRNARLEDWYKSRKRTAPNPKSFQRAFGLLDKIGQ